MRMETERSNRIKLSERSSSRIGKIPTETEKIRPKRMYMANGSNLIPVSTKNKIKKTRNMRITHTHAHSTAQSQYIPIYSQCCVVFLNPVVSDRQKEQQRGHNNSANIISASDTHFSRKSLFYLRKLLIMFIL